MGKSRQRAKKVFFRPTLKAFFYSLEEALEAYPQTEASQWLKADSEIEFRRFQFLIEKVMAGEITQLKHHPLFILQEQVKLPKNAIRPKKRTQGAITYEADASYMWNGILVIEDAKGSYGNTRQNHAKKRAGKAIIDSAARLRHKLLIAQLVSQYGANCYFAIVTKFDAEIGSE